MAENTEIELKDHNGNRVGRFEIPPHVGGLPRVIIYGIRVFVQDPGTYTYYEASVIKLAATAKPLPEE
jgi:hypothetical protein